VILGSSGGGSVVADKVMVGSLDMAVGGVDKGKGKRNVEGDLGSSLDGSKFLKVSMVGPVVVCITEVGFGEEEGAGSGLGDSIVGSGSTNLSRPDMVLVGPIAVHAEDVLALVPSSGGSADYNFQLMVHSVHSKKSKKAGTPLFSPFNTLNSYEVVSFIEDLGVKFNSLDSHKYSIIEEV
jgi:hypothetical protein